MVENTEKETLHGFVFKHTAIGATVYTDDHKSYKGLPYKHEVIRHSAGEYVKEKAHTNGIESFWSMLKRAHKGTFHYMSDKHMDRYVSEFAGRHNIREADTIDQMKAIAHAMAGKRLGYRRLIGDQ